MMGHGHVGESLLRYDGEHGSVAAIADYLKEIDPKLAELDPTRDRRADIVDRAQARRLPAGAARVHAAGDARRRRRRRAGARAHPVERAHHRGDQRRGGAAQRARAGPDPAREPPPAADRRDEPAQRRAGRAREPRQVALPDDDEPRAAEPAERRPRAAGAARPERHRRPPAASGRRRPSSRAIRCCSCCPACSTTARCRTGASSCASRALPRSRRSPMRFATRCAPRVPAAPRSPSRRDTPSGSTAISDRLRQVFVHLDALRARGPRLGRGSRPLRPRRDATSSARSPSTSPGEVDRLEARPADGPERARARPGDRRGAAAADRPRTDLGRRRRPEPGRGRGTAADDPGDDSRGTRSIRADSRAPGDPVRRARDHLPGGASLRADRFRAPEDAGPVDIVLVDSTSVGEAPLMSTLRSRFPGALFVSLGDPANARISSTTSWRRPTT